MSSAAIHRMTSPMRRALLVFAGACAIWAMACSKGGTRSESVDIAPSHDGVAIVDTFTVNATVADVDMSARKVTFSTSDGRTTTAKAGNDVDMNGFRIGERILATITEETALYLRKDGMPSSIVRTDAVAVAARESRHNVLMADTVEVTARVTAVHAAQHTVSLQFANGRNRPIKVGDSVNLSDFKPGDDVVARITEAIVVVTNRP